MTRKDYVLIADTIAQFSRDIANEDGVALSEENFSIWHGKRVALVSVAHRLADQLRQDNPMFDRKRFLAACQLDAERLA